MFEMSSFGLLLVEPASVNPRPPGSYLSAGQLTIVSGKGRLDMIVVPFFRRTSRNMISVTDLWSVRQNYKHAMHIARLKNRRCISTPTINNICLISRS